ncbi:hypothetical protein CASFOL_029716 [Castilleja foliolosa]|uniref:Replication factor A C-terminal domain-containing protein n=1 Tax=Castilleja foliolosa TaxID=1961234 RepID=A0ABD3C9B7_9LAMI
MPIARSLMWENDMEFHDVYPLFSQKAAEVGTIKWLTRVKTEDDKKYYWIYGKVVGVETTKPFWYHACFICGRGVQVVDGRKICLHCDGHETISNIYRYALDVVVADGTGVINPVFVSRSSDKVGWRAYSRCHRLPGLRVKTLPTFIEDEIMGKSALFEVILRSESTTAVRRFNVSRLSEDEEVLEQYELKYLTKEKEEADAGTRCKALEPSKRRRIV